ncbi:hypothetical protein LCGC14_2903930, partial [marine sediment metagenome]
MNSNIIDRINETNFVEKLEQG